MEGENSEPRPEAVDEFLGQTFDDLISLLPEKSQHRQSDGQVAAEEAAALDEPDLQPVFGSGLRRNQSGGSTANDEHVVFGADGNGPRGFLKGVHGMSRYKSSVGSKR